MIDFDATINLGTVIQTALVIAGGIYALGTMRGSLTTLQSEFSKMQEESEKKFDGIQTEIKKIGDLLAAQAATAALITGLTQRVDGHERDIRELRNADGRWHYTGTD